MAALTRYPNVDAVIGPLLQGVEQILGADLIGIYLFGSLVAGGFDRESDVDLLVATRQDLSADQFEQLKALHQRVAHLDSRLAVQIEATYIPVAALRRFDPLDCTHATLERGLEQVLYYMEHDTDGVVHRHILREKGVALLGPPPQTLIDPITPEDLRAAMKPVLDGWLAHLHETPDNVRSRGHQAYIVLTVCRVLYTLAMGEVASKPAAAQWAGTSLDPRWSPLIERALIGRQHPGDPITPADSDLIETFDFIAYALDVAHRLRSEI